VKTRLLIALLLCGTVRAEIIYFNYTSSPVGVTVTNLGNWDWNHSYINFTSSGAVVNTNGTDPYLYVGAYMHGTRDNGAALVEAAYESHIASWLVGTTDVISASSSWGTDEGGPGMALYWEGTDEKTMQFGFRLDQGGGNYYYGWAKVYGYLELDEGGAGVGFSLATARVLEMAYDNTLNQSIAVGAVPEPATALSLALGGLVIAGYRRVRKAYGC
jgi:hypothetical protein